MDLKYYQVFNSIVAFVGFLFARSGLEKFSSGTFPSTLGVILSKFSSANPYPWYSDFLEDFIIPHAESVAHIVIAGEILAGLGLLLSSLALLCNMKDQKVFIVYGVSAVIGLILNLQFWLAAGSQSPSTDSLNLLMMVIEICVGIVSIRALANVKPGNLQT